MYVYVIHTHLSYVLLGQAFSLLSCSQMCVTGPKFVAGGPKPQQPRLTIRSIRSSGSR